MIEIQVKDNVIDLIDYGKMIVNLEVVMNNKNETIYSLSKKTGIKYDIIKKYYYNDVYRIDLTNIAKIYYVLECRLSDIIKYVPPKEFL